MLIFPFAMFITTNLVFAILDYWDEVQRQKRLDLK
jgi:hypothetical protein